MLLETPPREDRPQEAIYQPCKALQQEMPIRKRSRTAGANLKAVAKVPDRKVVCSYDDANLTDR